MPTITSFLKGFQEKTLKGPSQEEVTQENLNFQAFLGEVGALGGQPTSQLFGSKIGGGMRERTLSSSEYEALLAKYNLTGKVTHGPTGGFALIEGASAQHSPREAMLRKYGLTGSDFEYTDELVPLYTRLLSSAEAPGGYLSPTSQSRAFASHVRGISGLFSRDSIARERAAAAAGIDPFAARRMDLAAKQEALSAVLAERARLDRELDERRFAAMSGFTNMLAQSTIAEKQDLTDTVAALKGADIAAKAQKSAANKALWGSIFGGFAKVASA